jgi:Fe-S cluster assembly protein SufB
MEAYSLSPVAENEATTLAECTLPEIDFQDIIYYAAAKKKPQYESLDSGSTLSCWPCMTNSGLPKEEQKLLAGVAVDFVMDSESVITTYKETLKEKGIIFCAISEAIREYPDPGQAIPR